MARFSLLRIFLPSWQLFEKAGTPLVPQVRVLPGVWQNCHKPVAMKPWSLFFNPSLNLHHALQSLTERFVIEAQEFTPQTIGDTFETSTSYGLMRNWAERLARGSNSSTPESEFQFRVVTDDGTEVVVSRLHALTPQDRRHA